MVAEGRAPAITRLELVEIAAGLPALGRELAARASRLLRMPCRLTSAPATLIVPELPRRNQADADRLLTALEALPAPPGCLRIAVTGRDIGHPIFTHFFGRARLGGRTVLVSTARLDPVFYGYAADPEVTLRRAAREVLHEIGHVGGLEHCRNWRCVMHFAATIGDLDNRGALLCRACAADLPPELAAAADATEDADL